MNEIGSKAFIWDTYARLGAWSVAHRVEDLKRPLLRTMDGEIALCLFARQRGNEFIGLDEKPLALITSGPRTIAMADTIEFRNPAGAGWILMNEARIPSYTSSIDAARMLLPSATKWEISSTGLVKLTYDERTIREKLLTPEISLAVAALQLNALLRP